MGLPGEISASAQSQTGTAAEQGSSRPPFRPWELAFLVFFIVSILTGVEMKCRRECLSFDELITGILVSNPSFSEMWDTIRRGGEVNPPLFFVLEWLVARCFGTGELAVLHLLAAHSPRASAETDESSGRPGLAALLILAVCWLAVPVGDWWASNVMQPFYMRRYLIERLFSQWRPFFQNKGTYYRAPSLTGRIFSGGR